ncbi:MAG: hypothetical protein GY854_02905 [Deltaproteobacteria bacterium]|nr:hypothetical protein [Deltaproteobacteria bacterium]
MKRYLLSVPIIASLCAVSCEEDNWDEPNEVSSERAAIQYRCVRYVDGDAESNGDGLTWETPFIGLEEAIAAIVDVSLNEQEECAVLVKGDLDGTQEDVISDGSLTNVPPGITIYQGLRGMEKGLNSEQLSLASSVQIDARTDRANHTDDRGPSRVAAQNETLPLLEKQRFNPENTYYPSEAVPLIGGCAFESGCNTDASGYASIAMGYQTLASGNYSLATGYRTTASGNYSTAMGYFSTASGPMSTAAGNFSEANGSESIAMGLGAEANGDISIAFGKWALAGGYGSIAMGREIEALGSYTVAVGLADMNGLECAQDNSMCIMGGNVGVGTPTPKTRLHVMKSDVPNTWSHAYDEMIVEDNDNYAIVNIVGPKTGTSEISFSDTDARMSGAIIYRHSNDNMDLRVNGATRARIESDGDFMVYKRLIPDSHKGADLGYNGRAWDDVYYDTLYNQGASAWNDVDLWSWHVHNDVMSKEPGMRDYRKENGAVEIDPANLPIQMTDKPTLIKTREAMNASLKTMGSRQAHIEAAITKRLQEMPDPATMSPSDYAINTGEMVSANFIVVNALVKEVELLKRTVVQTQLSNAALKLEVARLKAQLD